MTTWCWLRMAARSGFSMMFPPAPVCGFCFQEEFHLYQPATAYRLAHSNRRKRGTVGVCGSESANGAVIYFSEAGAQAGSQD